MGAAESISTGGDTPPMIFGRRLLFAQPPYVAILDRVASELAEVRAHMQFCIKNMHAVRDGRVVPPARNVSTHTQFMFNTVYFNGIDATALQMQTIDSYSHHRTLVSAYFPVFMGMLFHDMYVFANALTTCAVPITSTASVTRIPVSKLEFMCKAAAVSAFGDTDGLSMVWRAMGGRSILSAPQAALLGKAMLESRKVRVPDQPMIGSDAVIVANPDKASDVVQVPLAHPGNVHIKGADTYGVRVDAITKARVDSSVVRHVSWCDQPPPPAGTATHMAFRIMCSRAHTAESCPTTHQFMSIGSHFIDTFLDGGADITDLTYTTDTDQGLFLLAWMDAFLQGVVVDKVDTVTATVRVFATDDNTGGVHTPIPTLFSMLVLNNQSGGGDSLLIADPKHVDQFKKEEEAAGGVQGDTPLRTVLAYMFNNFSAM